MNMRQYAKRTMHGLLDLIFGKSNLTRSNQPLWLKLGASGIAGVAALCCITTVSARFDHNDADATTINQSHISPPISKDAPPEGVPQQIRFGEASLEQKNAGRFESGRIVATQDAMPHLSLASPTDPNTQIQYDLSTDAQILLNGSSVRLSELKPQDLVKITIGKDGLVNLVEATRSKSGIVVRTTNNMVTLTTDYLDKVTFPLASNAAISLNGKTTQISQLHIGDTINVIPNKFGQAACLEVTRTPLLEQFWENFRKNLFKPLLLFFYMGFLIPILKIAFEFPRAVYQGLTIYLLISIGWHGGEELSVLSGAVLNQALGFLVVGFLTNLIIGFAAYLFLRRFVPKLRKIDSATVAAYYGSDSAGTFVTCVGVLQVAHIAFAAYMPVMLAVMEIPGCLVGLYLVSRLRKAGMDNRGNMPGESGYEPEHCPPNLQSDKAGSHTAHEVADTEAAPVAEITKTATAPSGLHLVREVLLNPGLFLLFGGIIVGFISRLQGVKVVEADDKLFVTLFQGLLCLFLLEMGMTASRHLKDLTTASWRFVVFGLLAPNIFAITGMCVALIFSHLIHMPFQLGTYVLFAVLCGAASYIAVPAIQRIAIKEASPTLPLAASLGLTFSYNVTIGIPVYLVIAQNLLTAFPMSGA